MPDPATLEVLLARVEKADGGDRDLSAAIWHALEPEAFARAEKYALFGAPDLTLSVGEVLSLIGERLPEFRRFLHEGDTGDWHASIESPLFDEYSTAFPRPTPALALLRCLLQAELSRAELHALSRPSQEGGNG